MNNPPLIEAIFEIRWKVWDETKPFAGLMDIKFKFFPSRFHEKMSRDYPFVEILENSRIPDEMNFYLPRYRMRKEKNGYPLIQIGPGILTLNFDKSFNQDLFYENSKTILQTLFELMPDIKITFIQIHYIDGFDFDYENKNAFEFLDNKLETHFKFTPNLFENTNINPIPMKFHLESNYQVTDPVGFFICQLRSGLKRPNNTKVILMDTIFYCVEDKIPKKEEINEWITKVDKFIHEWFFKMINKMKGLFV